MHFLACLFLAAGCSTHDPVAAVHHGWVRSSSFDGIRYVTAGVSLPRRDFAGFSVGWQMDTGALVADNGDEDSPLASLGPMLQYHLGGPGGDFVVEIASRPTLLGKSHFDETDLGGKFHFASHAGLRWQSRSSPLEISFRFMHISNAGLRSANPGINFAIAGAGFRFGGGGC